LLDFLLSSNKKKGFKANQSLERSQVRHETG
jgi:hypothetical protein